MPLSIFAFDGSRGSTASYREPQMTRIWNKNVANSRFLKIVLCTKFVLFVWVSEIQFVVEKNNSILW